MIKENKIKMIWDAHCEMRCLRCIGAEQNNVFEFTSLTSGKCFSLTLVGFVFLMVVHSQVPGFTDEHQALPGSSWSFPRWLAELLPISRLASVPDLRSLTEHTDWGFGTSHSVRTKEQLLEVVLMLLDRLYFFQSTLKYLAYLYFGGLFLVQGSQQ